MEHRSFLGFVHVFGRFLTVSSLFLCKLSITTITSITRLIIECLFICQQSLVNAIVRINIFIHFDSCGR